MLKTHENSDYFSCRPRLVVELLNHVTGSRLVEPLIEIVQCSGMVAWGVWVGSRFMHLVECSLKFLPACFRLHVSVLLVCVNDWSVRVNA